MIWLGKEIYFLKIALAKHGNEPVKEQNYKINFVNTIETNSNLNIQLKKIANQIH